MKNILLLWFGTVLSLFAADILPAEGRENGVWVWIALFALAVIGVIILFASSQQTKRMQNMYREMLDKQAEMEKKQTSLLANMSENIHTLVSSALEENRKSHGKSLQPAGKGGEELGERLLSVTNDLIDFLRLKAHKVQIDNKEFNLNNVLNEISGSICGKYRDKKIDLIFDVNNNVPRHIIGDSLHLGQILNNIMEFMVERLDEGELKLEIEKYTTVENRIELQFRFSDTGEGMGSAEMDSLFIPYYDEERKRYYGLGMFVVKTLVEMMNGDIEVHSREGKGTHFTVTLQFELVNANDRRMYRLPDNVFAPKKVLIVDSNYNSSLAIKKTFAYFRHEVKTLSKEAFLKNMPNLSPYDIVVLHESLFSARLIGYLERLKQEKDLKVISLNSLFNTGEECFSHDVVNNYLYTPLNQERTFEMIIGMYDTKVLVKADTDRKKDQAKIYKSQILETGGITQSSFRAFAGKHILIVEDNIINQKVLENLLCPADIKITLADNGQEAVEKVKNGYIGQFDLVLMDINMPVLDGYAATQMIRLDDRFDSLPIIAFTALVLDSEIEKMYSSGINAFLSKPLNIGKLYTALTLFLSKQEEKREEEKKEKSVETTQLSFKGLDIDYGIQHANNSKILYMEILDEFVAAYGKSDAVFEKLVKEHRYEQIKMLCIDMRGLCGTIGAHEMQSLVIKISQAIIYKQESRLPDYVDAYRQELAKLTSSISEYLEASDYRVA